MAMQWEKKINQFQNKNKKNNYHKGHHLGRSNASTLNILRALRRIKIQYRTLEDRRLVWEIGIVIKELVLWDHPVQNRKVLNRIMPSSSIVFNDRKKQRRIEIKFLLMVWQKSAVFRLELFFKDWQQQQQKREKKSLREVNCPRYSTQLIKEKVESSSFYAEIWDNFGILS